VNADDPRLDQMIDTWREAQREALHRLPAFPWEGKGEG
jgi:predicted proteasome-type protease